MLLLELSLWIWKVWESCIEWSEKGCWSADPKYQCGKELMVSHHLFEGFGIRSSFYLSTGCFGDCSAVSFTGWIEPATSWPYYFKYCLSNQVFDMERAPISATKADSSSPELVREATSFSVSLVEIPTTLLEDALALPLDFLCVTVIYCWLSIMSGWTPIISPRGVETGTRSYSFFVMRISIDNPQFPFRDGNHSR